jgi:hypothetical protein
MGFRLGLVFAKFLTIILKAITANIFDRNSEIVSHFKKVVIALEMLLVILTLKPIFGAPLPWVGSGLRLVC